jgi:hypothetical protein
MAYFYADLSYFLAGLLKNKSGKGCSENLAFG